MRCLSAQADPDRPSSPSRLAGVIVGLAGLSYPFLVLLGLHFLPHWMLLLVPVLLLAARMALGRRGPAEAVLGLAALVVLTLDLFNPELAVRVWPVVVSLGLAILFGASFRWGPVMVERIAEAAEGPMPAVARPYLRRVTAVWVCFFVVNGAIAAWTVWFGTLEQWALYNGLISYILVGSLMLGEMLLRRMVRPKHAA